MTTEICDTEPTQNCVIWHKIVEFVGKLGENVEKIEICAGLRSAWVKTGKKLTIEEQPNLSSIAKPLKPCAPALNAVITVLDLQNFYPTQQVSPVFLWSKPKYWHRFFITW